MNVLWGLVLAAITFFVLNLFLPAGWAGLAALLVFVLSIMGGNLYPPRRL